jgi:L-asparaginase / beta-aspartyl-peptidase
MKRLFTKALLIFLCLPLLLMAQKPDYVLVIHGGAGGMNPDRMSTEQVEEAQNGLQQALDAGEMILKAGGSALDAVEAAVRLLENHPDFNAGRGAVFNADGKIELDASIMDGSNLMAGQLPGFAQ